MNIYTNVSYLDKNNDWWISSATMNAIIHLKENGENNYLGRLEGSKTENGWNVGKIFEYKECIYFFSRYEFTYWTYSKVTGKIEKHEYLNDDVKMIVGYEIEEEHVWIFPNNFLQPIIKLNLDNLNVKSVFWNCDKVYGEKSITRTIYRDGYIFFATRKPEHIRIGVLCTENDEIQYVDVFSAKYVNCIDVSDNELLAVCRKADGQSVLVKMNMNSKDMVEINLPNELKLFDSSWNRYFRIVVKNEEIFLFGISNYMVEVLNLKDLSVRYIKEEFGPYEGGSDQDIVRNDIQVKGDLIYIFSPILGRIQVLDTRKHTLSHLELNIENEWKKAVVDNIRKEGVVKENKGLELSRFLESIVSND